MYKVEIWYDINDRKFDGGPIGCREFKEQRQAIEHGRRELRLRYDGLALEVTTLPSGGILIETIGRRFSKDGHEYYAYITEGI